MGGIEHDAATGTWLLTTATSGYAFRLEPGGELRHLYWGSRLTLPQLLAADRGRPPVFAFDSPWDGITELPSEGGPRFGVPSLQVRFANGTRAVEWVPDGDTAREADGQHLLEIRLRDRHYPLGVVLSYRVFDDCDVIERWVTVRHLGHADPTGADPTGADPIEVFRADSAAWALPRLAGYRVSYTTGRWGAETQLRRHEVPVGELTLTSRRGISSHHVNPWVMLDEGTAAETAGEVWSAALAWSGAWRITLQRTSDDRLSVTGGFGHDAVRWPLAPGESLTSPVFAGLHTAAGFGAASRAWHWYIRAHVLPRPAETRPVLFNSWEATGFDISERNQQELANLAAIIGVELFVVDDGWFGARTSDRRGLGDWIPNPERFPHGLRPLAGAVHDLGMKFGIWVEPEMVNPDSDLYRAHPEWVLHSPERRRTELRHQLVLNFARPDVSAWAHGWLDELIGANGIDFIKWDMNRPFTEAGWPDAPRDADWLWIDHVRAVYSIMERLRADHPGLRIESCSGGGGRVDLGILARTDQAWTSDNTDALDRIAIQGGYAQLYPPGTMSAWVTDSPNQLTNRRIPLRFRFHVAMAGVLGIGGNLLKWSGAELAEAADLIAAYKQVRDTVQHGSLYRLAPRDADVTAVQYLGAHQAVLLAWRHAPHYGRQPQPIPLAGLDPAGTYLVNGAEHAGICLLTQGLPVDFPDGDYGSVLAVLEKAGGGGTSS